MTAAVASKKEQSAPMEQTGFEGVIGEQGNIPISDIRISEHKLRDAERNSEEYQDLLHSVAGIGVQLPVLVRRGTDPETGKEVFNLIDGVQRFSAAQESGHATIPARIISATDAQVMARQIILNRAKIETKPAQYTAQLHRMLMADPLLTLDDLAAQLYCSKPWLEQRFSLLNLHKDAMKLVDDHKIKLTNAYVLAKIKPPDDQLQFLEPAMTEPNSVFSDQVNNYLKAVREAARAGRAPGERQFEPNPTFRTRREVLGVVNGETPEVASNICRDLNATDAISGFVAATKWMMHLDPAAIQAQKERFEKNKATQEAEKARRAEERARKRKEEAAQAVENLGKPTNGAPQEQEGEPDDEE